MQFSGTAQLEEPQVHIGVEELTFNESMVLRKAVGYLAQSLKEGLMSKGAFYKEGLAQCEFYAKILGQLDEKFNMAFGAGKTVKRGVDGNRKTS